MRAYQGETVIQHIRARSMEKDCLDCVCDVLLTDAHVIVAEDNFDGTWTEHYVLPMRDMVSIGLRGVEAQGKKGAQTSGRVADALGAALGGLFGARERQTTPVGSQKGGGNYLCIAYRDGEALRQLYFYEWSGNIRKMSKALEQVKLRRVL